LRRAPAAAAGHADEKHAAQPHDTRPIHTS
jgi:hypothetical protein